MRPLLLLAATTMLACTSPSDSKLESGLLRWGTSFGMCAGYCRTELVIDSLNMQLTRTGWDPQRNPPVVQNQATPPSDWRQLASQVNPDAFRQLQDVYGCPDCADGGAEWVELETAGFKKRVTFEYNKAPAEIKDAVSALRSLRGKFPQ